MRNLLLPFLSVIILLNLSSCGSPKTGKTEKSVIVSILPQKYLVDKITGGNLKCEVMIPPGGNHETFEPSPRDIERVSRASAYFTIGALDFEKAWIEKVSAVNPELKIVNTSKGIKMIEGHSHHGLEAETHSVDPHTWLAPDAMKIQATEMCYALCHIYPDDSVVYRRNLAAFIKEADSADHIITELLKPYEGGTFLIYHPALAYLAREYRLNQESIEFEGKEPSPVHMRKIIDMAKAKGIKTIFVSKEFDTRHAETIADQLGGNLVTFDPMAYNWTENILSIGRLMAGNLDQETTETSKK
jgi:zinc transport system substrate-binding protein